MKKRFIIVTAVALVCLLAVGATVAWLTASASVSNTFTVGKIAITIAEPTWASNSKIYPGAIISKDPTITVTAGSEDCYVYAMVDNQLNGTISGAVSLNVPADWAVIGTNNTKTVYRYNATVASSAADQTLTPVFTTVTVSGSVVTEANINSLNNGKIDVKAYAHQSNATTPGDADAAALAHFGL
jgi:predicted ribosomally synthesized peptide with SipW-like signal peptide